MFVCAGHVCKCDGNECKLKEHSVEVWMNVKFTISMRTVSYAGLHNLKYEELDTSVCNYVIFWHCMTWRWFCLL